MNTVLDVLKLRRVKLEYISPAICPPLFSASGSSILLAEPVEGAKAPVGFLTGSCDRFLAWQSYPGLICMSLFVADDPGDEFTLRAECSPAQVATVTSPGWWAVAVLDENGVELSRSTPVLVDGTKPVQLSLPGIVCGVVPRIVILKNPDPANPSGEMFPIFDGNITGAFEIPDPDGCYRLQAITPDGASALSNVICRTEPVNCCPAQPCSAEETWDPVLCSCVPDTFSDLLGPLDHACIGEPYVSQLEALGAQGPCTWELDSGSLPPGLTLVTGTIPGNTTSLTGTPTVAGVYTFTIECTNVTTSSITKSFSIRILGIDQAPALTSGTTDTAYSLQLTTSGGSGAVAFAVTSGALPDGLSMTSAGLIMGSPFFSGSYAFEITVTDSTGLSCSIALSLEINPCPSVSTHPVISQWTGSDYFFNALPAPAETDFPYIALDRERRTLWLPKQALQSSPPWTANSPHSPYQVVNLVDTRQFSFIGYPNDPSGLMNTAAKGDTTNDMGRCVIDTKYGTCVVGGDQGWFPFYDLATKNLNALVKLTNPGQFLYRAPAYDANRGYLYLTNSTSAIALLSIVTCQPGVQGVLATYFDVSFNSGECAYCPDNDMVYIANTNGPNAINKFVPRITPPFSGAGTFITNVGPAGAGEGLRYIRGIGLIMVKIGGDLVFVDPLNSDTEVGRVTFGGANEIYSHEYNDCNGHIYVLFRSSGNRVIDIDPSSWTFTFLTPANGNTYGAMAFDADSNRLFIVNSNNWSLETY